jgi:membrane-associated phospholipid phosphatase
MRTRRWGAAAALAGAAIGVAAGTKRGRGRRLDERIYAVVNGRLEHRVLDQAFAALTELGSMYASAVAAGSLALGGRRRAAARALGAAGTMWAIGQFLKKVYGRPRPFLSLEPGRLLIGRPQGTSWPSIHPATLAAFVAVAARDLDAGPAGRVMTMALPAAVAASRVYLGVHYPSDVVGGLLLGGAVALAWSPDGEAL